MQLIKKKIIRRVAFFCCIAICMNGCAYGPNLPFAQQEKITDDPEQTVQELQSPLETQEQPEEVVVSKLYYSYHMLDSDRQKIYREILMALTEMKADVTISTLDKSVIDPIFVCVMNDHPELFYVEGYQYTEYTFGNAVTEITFSGTYSMTQQEAEETRQLIEQRVEECFDQMPSGEDEYDIVKYLYDWLINHTEYDRSAQNNQNICSVFLQGSSVCQGYAKAMQYMLQKIDIQSLLVTGFTNGERHAWNLVKVNGEYYYLDPTWGDASYTSDGSEHAQEGVFPTINYDYFLVTTDEITRTHSFEKVVELPECSAVNDNYFVREKLYFNQYDEERLLDIFGSEKARTEKYVAIKCSDEQSFGTMMQNLIENQKIFDLIDQQGKSVAYAFNEEQHIISFWNLY